MFPLFGYSLFISPLWWIFFLYTAIENEGKCDVVHFCLSQLPLLRALENITVVRFTNVKTLLCYVSLGLVLLEEKTVKVGLGESEPPVANSTQVLLVKTRFNE